jgi:hypothetical protein
MSFARRRLMLAPYGSYGKASGQGAVPETLTWRGQWTELRAWPEALGFVQEQT